MPLDPTLLAHVQTVITHERCPDGIASALLLKDALGPVEILFMQPGEDRYKALLPRDLPNGGEGLLFCDLAPPVGQAADFLDAGSIVLDHHKTNKPIVEKFVAVGRGVFGDEQGDPGVCGAVLAFRHVWTPRQDEWAVHVSQEAFQNSVQVVPVAGVRERAQRFATLAGVRDTWQTHDPRWADACAQAEMLLFYPPEDWIGIKYPFSPSGDQWWSIRMELGKLLYQKHLCGIPRALDKAHRFQTDDGLNVVMFQGGSSLASDGSEVLANQGIDLVVGFGFIVEKGRPKMLLSLRTPHPSTAFDCGAFAASLGGGGHTRSAGIALDLLLPLGEEEDYTPNPYIMVERLLRRWGDR